MFYQDVILRLSGWYLLLQKKRLATRRHG